MNGDISFVLAMNPSSPEEVSQSNIIQELQTQKTQPNSTPTLNQEKL